MSPITIPKPLDPSKYTLTFDPPTYSQLVQDNLGNLGTPGDGMDAALLDAGALSDGVGASIGDMGTGITGVPSTFLGGPDQGLADLASQLAPASTGVDNALADYNGIVQPSAPVGGTPNTLTTCSPGQVVNGLTIGQPDPHPYPGIAANVGPIYRWTNLPVMCVGDGAKDYVVQRGLFDATAGGGGGTGQGFLVYEEGGVFNEHDTQDFTDPANATYVIYLTVMPIQAGQFQAVVQVPVPASLAPGQAGQGTAGYYNLGYRVTFVNAP